MLIFRGVDREKWMVNLNPPETKRSNQMVSNDRACATHLAPGVCRHTGDGNIKKQTTLKDFLGGGWQIYSPK